VLFFEFSVCSPLQYTHPQYSSMAVRDQLCWGLFQKVELFLTLFPVAVQFAVFTRIPAVESNRLFLPSCYILRRCASVFSGPPSPLPLYLYSDVPPERSLIKWCILREGGSHEVPSPGFREVPSFRLECPRSSPDFSSC